MDPIIIPLAKGFEEIEFSATVDILRRLDVPVVTAGVEARLAEGFHGLVMQADMLLVDVDAALYSGVILPGGPASWTLRDTPAVRRLVRDMNAAGKLVAAICAAPIVLQAAGVLKGRRVTAYPDPSVTGELTDPLEITSDAVVRDGNIVTGRGPCAAFAFAFALAGHIGVPGSKIQEMKKAMCLSE